MEMEPVVNTFPLLYSCSVSYVELGIILRCGHCSDGTARISEVRLYIYIYIYIYIYSIHCLDKSIRIPRNIHALIVPFIEINIQLGAKMVIEIYRYQKFVVLALTWVKFLFF